MLSEQEKREMKEMAASASVREEFEQLRLASRFDPRQPVNVDQLAAWLTMLSRAFPPSPPRTPIEYPNAKL